MALDGKTRDECFFENMPVYCPRPRGMNRKATLMKAELLSKQLGPLFALKVGFTLSRLLFFSREIEIDLW